MRNEDAPYAFVVLVENGGGGNAVNRMITGGVRGIDFIAINTDKHGKAAQIGETDIILLGKIHFPYILQYTIILRSIQ